jgi:hypothetical protein
MALYCSLLIAQSSYNPSSEQGTENEYVDNEKVHDYCLQIGRFLEKQTREECVLSSFTDGVAVAGTGNRQNQYQTFGK